MINNQMTEDLKRELIKDYKSKNENLIFIRETKLKYFYEKLKYIYKKKNGIKFRNYIRMHPFIIQSLGERRYFGKFADIKIDLDSATSEEMYTLEQLYNLRVFYNPRFINKKLKKKQIKIKLIYRLRKRKKHPYTLRAYETYDSEDVEVLTKPRRFLNVEESSNLLKARKKALIAFSKNALKNANETIIKGNSIFYKTEDIQNTFINDLKIFQEELLNLKEIYSSKDYELEFHEKFLNIIGQKMKLQLLNRTGLQKLYKENKKKIDQTQELGTSYHLMVIFEKYLLMGFFLIIGSILLFILKLLINYILLQIKKLIIFINKGPLIQRFINTIKFSKYRIYSLGLKLKTIGMKFNKNSVIVKNIIINGIEKIKTIIKKYE